MRLAILAFASAALVAPIWTVSVVPTQDGPIHLAQADLIARFGWRGTLTGLAGHFYEWTDRIDPNLLAYFVMAGSIRAAADPFLGQTVYLTIYALAFIGGAWFLAASEQGGSNERTSLATLLMLPLAFGLYLHFGFFSYTFGIALFLWFAAFWRFFLNARRSAFRLAAAAVLLFLLALTHIVAVAAALLLLTADGLARALTASREGGFASGAKTLAADGWKAAAVAAPSLLLASSFLLSQPAPTSLPEIPDWSALRILTPIVTLASWYAFNPWELAALAPAWLAFVVGASFGLRRSVKTDPTWAIFLALVVFGCLLDLRTRLGVSLSERLAPFSVIAFAMIAAQGALRPSWRAVLLAFACFGLAGQSAMRIAAYRAWAPTMEASAALGRGHPASALIGITQVKRDASIHSWRVQPALHAAQLAAVAGGGVALSSSLPSVAAYGYFPLRYKPGNDFFRAAIRPGGLNWENAPDPALLAQYQMRTGSNPTMAIVLGSRAQVADVRTLFGFQHCQNSGERNSGENVSVAGCFLP